MKYYELVAANREAKHKVSSLVDYDIKVLSNITVDTIAPYIEYSLRNIDINANAYIGEYDNILQEATKINGFKACIIFWELCNVVEGFQYNALVMSEDRISDIIEKVKNELDFVLENLASVPVVIWNKFSTLLFNSNNVKNNKMDDVCEILNEYLEAHISTNVILVDLNRVIANTGIKNAGNFRDFYSAKSLYSNIFYEHYADHVLPIFRSLNGKSKKALILDCDNTLWSGVIGEDGLDGISMSPEEKENGVFTEVQQYINYLAKNGVILGLASKNNPEDIAEVFKKNRYLSLDEENIAIRKINWNSKVDNLHEISKELNIGLDSMVFLDDSPFEANLIKESVSEIDVYQVPKIKGHYPELIRNIARLFFNVSATAEDSKRNEMYKAQLNRVESQKHFVDINDYLESLGLKLSICIDDEKNISRLSQLTQKTNQFNLTTKRYSEQEIEEFIGDKNYNILSMNVADKYGDSGLVGLAIIQLIPNGVAVLDSLLMSCRILGRNIEYSFFDELVKWMGKCDVTDVKMSYIPTPKNMQVSDLCDKLGAELGENLDGKKCYLLTLSKYKYFNYQYIEVAYGK